MLSLQLLRWSSKFYPSFCYCGLPHWLILSSTSSSFWNKSHPIMVCDSSDVSSVVLLMYLLIIVIGLLISCLEVLNLFIRHIGLQFSFLCLKTYLFTWERERERGSNGGSLERKGREFSSGSPLNVEPDTELSLTTLQSLPELKSRIRHLTWDTQVPPSLGLLGFRREICFGIKR